MFLKPRHVPEVWLIAFVVAFLNHLPPRSRKPSQPTFPRCTESGRPLCAKIIPNRLVAISATRICAWHSIFLAILRSINGLMVVVSGRVGDGALSANTCGVLSRLCHFWTPHAKHLQHIT
jgi:hypothetical protein